MGSPISQELFLARARARFGEAYDYSRMVYKSFKTPIKIRCTTHPVKEIAITPEKHLQTTGGCKFCLREKRIRKLEHDFNAACPAPLRAPSVSATRVSPPALTTIAAHQDSPAMPGSID